MTAPSAVTARWATTFRLAWRLVRKAPGRSALIALLVAVPVFAGAFVAVTIRTAQLSPDQAADRTLGRADAIAVVTPYRTLDPGASAVGRGATYGSDSVESVSAGGRTRRSAAVDLPALLPAGARAVPVGWQHYVQVTAGRRAAFAPAVLVDLGDPLTMGLYDLRAGRRPDARTVAVTTHLATRLRLHPGSTVSLAGRTLTVAGVVRDPQSLSSDAVLGSATAFGGRAFFPGPDANQDLTWLVSFPATAPDLHDELAGNGIIYETRKQWEQPPAAVRSHVRVDAQVVAVLGSIVGFGLAEIVLLAGTAFAVGTRRQVRELGLLRTIGGDQNAVRRAVLGQGVLLGGLGALVGVVFGAATVFLCRPVLEHATDRAFGPLDARPLELVAVAALGLIAGYLAAVVPARSSARLPVLDMLRTRFPVDAGTVRNPRWAWAALGLGPLVVIAAALAWHHDIGGLGPSVSTPVNGNAGHGVGAITASHDGIWTALISVGAAITLAGLARSCPTLLTRAGRLAARLPLSPRLALRDAARHRHRSAPAAAAVATVIAGAVIVMFVVSSTDVRDRRSYLPLVPVGTVSVSVGGSHPTTGAFDTARALVTTALHARSSTTIHQALLAHQGSDDRVGVHDPQCVSGPRQTCDVGPIAVADPATIATILGHAVPAADHVLATGGAVVLRSDLVRNGQVGIDELRFRNGSPTSVTGHVAAFVLRGLPDFTSLPSVFVSATTASAHGWPTVPLTALVRPPHIPSTAVLDRLSHRLGKNAGIYAERGYEPRLGLVLLALVGGAAIATLMGTSIAVALAMAESRADMATLAAVGASPSRRRVHAMAQAAAVGALGAALGLALGCLVGVALLEGSTSYPFSLPLRWLALLLVAAPVLAVVVAGAATRSRLPLTRRIA